MKTDAELKQLAMDLIAGKVFTDRSCRNAMELQMIFLPLAFLKDEALENFKAEDPQMLYEYLDKAGPRSINGNPSFTSMQFLNKQELMRMIVIHDKLKAAIKDVQP